MRIFSKIIFYIGAFVIIYYSPLYAEDKKEENATGESASGEKPFIYDAHGKRDPFWPLVSSTGAIVNYDQDFLITDLQLEGVVLGAGGNMAIINGKIYKLNDKVGLFDVQEIKENVVILSKDGQTFELRLKKEE